MAVTNKNKPNTRAFVRRVRVLYPFLYFLLVPLIRTIFYIRGHNTAEINSDQRGCVLISNHQSMLDGVLLNVPLRRQIQYLIADSNMRTRSSRLLFWFFGGIAKTKLMNDFQSLRRIVGVVRAGGLVGIFPEALASWDGDPKEIVPSTARFIKFLRAPVYVAEIYGTYFVLPRWGHGMRRGLIDISFRPLFTSQQLQSLTVAQIHDKIQHTVGLRTQKEQRTRRYRYRSIRRAEHCERMLFLCPHCQGLGTITSAGNLISCTRCGVLAEIDQYYALRPPPPSALLLRRNNNRGRGRGAVCRPCRME